MNTIGISNIQITNNIGEQFSLANYEDFLLNRIVKVSFDLDYENITIKSIKYTIWTKNDLSVFEKTYYVSSNRSHNFILDGDHGGLYYGETFGDVITIQIDITDINGLINSFYAEKLIPSPILNSATKSGFSRVYGSQRQDGSQLVDIYYNYTGLSGINASNVSSYLSIDDGVNWSAIPQNNMRGDIGSGVMPGLNRVIWNPLLTLSSLATYPSDVEIKLILNDADENVNIGVESSPVVIDLYKAEIAIRKLSVKEELLIFNSSSSSSIDSSSSTSYSSSSSLSSASFSSLSSNSSNSSGSSLSSNSSNSSSSSSSSSSKYSSSSTSSNSSSSYSPTSFSSSSSSFGNAFGRTWSHFEAAGGREYSCIDCSPSGQYVYLSTTRQGSTYIYRGFNYEITPFTSYYYVQCDNLSVSGNNQYVASVNFTDTEGFQPYDLGGRINLSSNSGATFSIVENIRYWKSVCISYTGQYISAVEIGGKIYVSVNTGASFTPVNEKRAWRSICMSDNGQYQTAVDCGGKIYVSIDTGTSFTPVNEKRNWYAVAMSSTGQYQTAVEGGTSLGNIYISSDYGTSFNLVASLQDWRCVCMSGDGQYQASAVYGGKIYVSVDYGNNWTETSSIVNTWISITMSSSGNYMYAIGESAGSTYFSKVT